LTDTDRQNSTVEYTN